MKKARNWQGFTKHWPLITIGVFIFIAFSGLLAKSLNRHTQLENVHIILPSSSTAFILRPLDHDSLGVSASSSFELQSPIKLHAEQIYANLKFNPANHYRVAKLNDSWKITFNQAFPTNQLIKATLTAFNGNTVSSSTMRAFAWSYQVRAPLSISSTIPIDQVTEVPLDSRIIIRLSHDNFYDAAKHLSIEPSASGTFSHVGRNLIFTPDKPYIPRTIHTVTLKKTLPFANTYDKLPNDFRFSFETAATDIEKTRDFSIDSRLLQFPSDIAPVLEIAANQANLELATTLFSYDSADNFIKDLSDNALPWWSKNKTIGHLNFQNGREVFKFNQLVASSSLVFPVRLAPGFYLARLSSKATTNYAWFQVADISAFSSLDYNSLLVWVNDKNGPLESADLQVFGADDSHRTNDKGVALFKTPRSIQTMLDKPSFRQQIYLKIKHDGQQAVLPVFDFSSYKFSEEKNAADKYAYSWAFNRSSYGVDDEVVFAGLISARDYATIHNIEFDVHKSSELLTYLDTIKPLYSSSTTPTNNRFEIRLPRFKYLPGDYALTIRVNGEYLDRAYFHVSNCNQSSSSLQAQDNFQEQYNRHYSINDPIKIVFASDQRPATEQANNYLYIKYKDGFKWYDNAASPIYETVFTPDLVPNFFLTYIHHNATDYEAGQQIFISSLSSAAKSYFRPVTSGIWSQTASSPLVNSNDTTDDETEIEAPAQVSTNTCQDNISALVDKLGTSSKITVFQLADGGLSLNRQGPSNLGLTSLITLTATTDGFDRQSLYGYLLNKLETADAQNEEISLAMSGLIGLDEPLLNRLASWINYRHDLNGKEKVYILLALNKLGAQEWRKQFINKIDIRNLSLSEKNILEYAQ